MDFQRARTEEQREHRRRVLLETAAAMLAEMPVATLSLNELSRRAGLAKSNVLRYFESREAILLELLDSEAAAWVSDLEAMPYDATGEFGSRADALVAAVVTTLEARPVLCDLISSQAAVLERNVSMEAVLRHKRAMLTTVDTVARITTARLPELDVRDGADVASAILMAVAAAWPHSTPTEALLAAYAMAVTPIADIAATILCLVLLGAFYAATGGVLAALAGQLATPATRATGIAAVQTVVAVSRFLAATAFGVVWYTLGADRAMLAAAVLLALAIPAAALILRPFWAPPAASVAGSSSDHVGEAE